MADTNNQTMVIYTDAIARTSSTWKSSFEGSGITDIDVESVFSSLVEAGVGTAYIPSLKKALSKAEGSVLATINSLNQLAQNQNGNDDKWKNYDTNGSRSYGSRNNNNGYTPPGGGNNTPPIGTEPPTNPPVDINVNNDLVDKVNNLSIEDYSELMTALGSIKNEELLSYLVDPNQASALKKFLLEKVKLPKDLQKMVSEMDENELQLTLMSILTDETTIPDISKSVIYNYTEGLSKKTNLQDSELSKYFFYNVDDFSSIVNAALKDDGKIQKVLLNLYEGNDVNSILSDLGIKDSNSAGSGVTGGVGEVSVEFIRSSIDEICKKNNIDYETLLTDSSKKGLLKEELSGISKGLSYFKAVNGLGNEASDLLFQSFILKKDTSKNPGVKYIPTDGENVETEPTHYASYSNSNSSSLDTGYVSSSGSGSTNTGSVTVGSSVGAPSDAGTASAASPVGDGTGPVDVAPDGITQSPPAYEGSETTTDTTTSNPGNLDIVQL